VLRIDEKNIGVRGGADADRARFGLGAEKASPKQLAVGGVQTVRGALGLDDREVPFSSGVRSFVALSQGQRRLDRRRRFVRQGLDRFVYLMHGRQLGLGDLGDHLLHPLVVS